MLPLINEYERSSTTVINAYVRPIVERYLSRLIGEVARIGIDVPLLLMQSNGGLTTAKAAAVTPMHIIESGPAAGVVGVQALCARIGIRKAISFDMGGTTAKASLIENGEVTRAAEYQVGAGIVLGSRLLSGAGYTLKVPAIDLAEIGAGGGSILWIDAGGALQVGPHSAGASPGPVAYDQGGEEPTVTDANLALGYLNPGHLVGGALKLNADKARAVIAEKIAGPLGMSLEAAAYGAHLIAASNMIRAIKAVSSERGRDPREYALVAFGGNGPIFAAGMAQEIGIDRVLIPPSAGVFSSFGLLYAEVEYYFTRTRKRLLRGTSPAELQAVLDGLEGEARTRLGEDGFAPDRIDIRRFASLHYQGQSFELRVPVAAGALDAAALAAIEEAFGVEHERTYGHRAGVDEPVELVSLEVIGRGIPETPRAASAAAASLAPDIAIAAPTRRAYFGPSQGWLEARVVNRSTLATPHLRPLHRRGIRRHLPRPARLGGAVRRIRQYRDDESGLKAHQRSQPGADFVKYAIRGAADNLQLAGLTVHAAHVIDENDARYRQSGRKLYLGPPTPLSGSDGTDDGQSGVFVEQTRGTQYDAWSSSALLAAGMWRKQHPNQVATVGQVHQMSSSPIGQSSSINSLRSGVIPTTSSSIVNRRRDGVMTIRPSSNPSISTRAPSVSPARVATSRGTRRPRLLPRFCHAQLGCHWSLRVAPKR